MAIEPPRQLIGRRRADDPGDLVFAERKGLQCAASNASISAIMAAL